MILPLIAIIIASPLLLVPTKPASAVGCQVVDANFRSNVNWPSDDFITDTGGSTNPMVYVDIQTQDCVGETIRVSISAFNSALASAYPDQAYYDDGAPTSEWIDLGAADNLVINVTQPNLTLYFRSADEKCFAEYGDWDCMYIIRTWDSDSPNSVLSLDLQGELWETAYTSSSTWSDNLALLYDCPQFPTCVFGPAWQYLGVHDYLSSSSDDQNVTIIPPNPAPTIQDTGTLSNLPGLPDSSPDAPHQLQSFLQALFNILIMVAGILAILMIVIGAITYLSAGALSGKETGREMMTGAVFGLILALGAWVIINTINPNLASDLSIEIPLARLHVPEGGASVYGTSPTASGDGYITAFQLPTGLGFDCPSSGGSAAVPSIIDSFVGKVAYRWGGKGGPLPAGASFPLSPSETNNPFTCKNDAGENVPCNTFCPGGNACLDCSGFVNHVRQCAGLPVYLTDTAGMTNSSDAQEVNMSQLNANGTMIGNYTLVPGDLLVWDGHVVIYYGSGKIAESLGGSKGRQKNGNVEINSIKKYKNKITHIIRVP